MTSTPTNNACGDLNDYTRRDREERITKEWTWEVEEGDCGVIVERANDPDVEQFARVCPSSVVTGNNKGILQMKTFDGGNSRLSAFGDELEFADINKPEGIKLKELIACCGQNGSSGSGGPGAGTNAVQMINFPNAGTFEYEAGVQTKTYWDASEQDVLGDYNEKWNDTSLYNVFNRTGNAQIVTMPPGTNAAVLFFSYGVTITPTELVPDSQDGYANVSYNMEISDNKGSVNFSPGALAAPVRVRTRILGWNEAKLIGQDSPGSDADKAEIRRKRAPGLSSTGYKAVRISFATSGENADATRITLKPMCNVQRVRRCKVTVGSGRVVCIPFFNDGDNFVPIRAAGVEDVDYDDLVTDDGVVDIAFEEQQESNELKQLMNYYLTSISETLNYDASLDPSGIPILEKALNDIFALKQLTGSTPEYYYTQLDAIRVSVSPYVAFQFGFETQVPETLTF